MSNGYDTNDYDELINALDELKAVRAERRNALNQSGHYDPHNYQQERYVEDVNKATERLDAIFAKLVRRHQRGCACPDQPLG